MNYSYGECCCTTTYWDVYRNGYTLTGVYTTGPHRSPAVYREDYSGTVLDDAKADTMDADWDDSNDRFIYASASFKRASGGDVVFVSSRRSGTADWALHCFYVSTSDGYMVEQWSHSHEIAKPMTKPDAYGIAFDASDEDLFALVGPGDYQTGSEVVYADSGGVTTETPSTVAWGTGLHSYNQAIAGGGTFTSGAVIYRGNAIGGPFRSACRCVTNYPWFLATLVEFSDVTYTDNGGVNTDTIEGTATLKIVKGEIDFTSGVHALKNVSNLSASFIWTTDFYFEIPWVFGVTLPTDEDSALEYTYGRLWFGDAAVQTNDTNSDPLPLITELHSDDGSTTVVFNETYIEEGASWPSFLTYDVTDAYRNYNSTREQIASGGTYSKPGYSHLVPLDGGVAAALATENHADTDLRVGSTVETFSSKTSCDLLTSGHGFIYLQFRSGSLIADTYYTGTDADFTDSTWGIWRVNHTGTLGDVWEPLRVDNAGTYDSLNIGNTDWVDGSFWDVVQDPDIPYSTPSDENV